MLEIRDIHKSFHDTKVLRGVDISVEKGDVVVILGPSGSGKTTLLRSINFLEKADHGTLTLEGKTIDFKKATKKQKHEFRLKTGFVFQSYHLFLNKTALGNVMEGLTVARKIPKAQANEIAKKALDKVGLSDRYDYYPHLLSGGQQQRIGIARAIATNPEVIFFDEPTSALDPELIDGVLAVMKQLAAEGTTMVIVTHELSFARDVANKVYFIDDGMVVESGNPKDIIQHPKEERTRQFMSRINREVEYYI